MDVLNALEYNFSVSRYIVPMISSYLRHKDLSLTPTLNVNYDGILRQERICRKEPLFFWIRRLYCGCYHGQEYRRGTSKTETCYIKKENMVGFPRARPGYA